MASPQDTQEPGLGGTLSDSLAIAFPYVMAAWPANENMYNQEGRLVRTSDASSHAKRNLLLATSTTTYSWDYMTTMADIGLLFREVGQPVGPFWVLHLELTTATSFRVGSNEWFSLSYKLPTFPTFTHLSTSNPGP